MTVVDKIKRNEDVGSGLVGWSNANTGKAGLSPAECIEEVETPGWRMWIRTLLRRSKSHQRSASRKGNKHALSQQQKIPLEIAHKTDKKQDDMEAVQEREDQQETEAEVFYKNNTDSSDGQSSISGNKSSRTDVNEGIGKKLFKSKRGQHRRLKALVGVIVGLLLGGTLFAALVFNFHYSLPVAGGIAGASTAMMCVGLAVSVHARCATALIFPSLFTGKGRATVLSVISGLLLMGPIMNITNNANEVATSMACTTELAYNQSRALQQQLEEPLREIQKTLEDTATEVKDRVEILVSAIEIITNSADTVKNGLETVSGALRRATQQCKRSLNGVFTTCQSKLNEAKRRCEREIRKINPKNIVDKIDPRGWLGRRKRDTPRDNIGAQWLHPPFHQLKRIRRQSLTDICRVLDVGQVCGVLQGVDFCQPVSLSDNFINRGIRRITDGLGRINDLFSFQLTTDSNVGGEANSSKSAAQIIKGIREDFTKNLNIVIFTINTINMVLSLGVFILFLQSCLYLRSYLAKLTYDNIYITTQFKVMDRIRKEAEQESVLPLKKREKKIYIDTTSPRLSPTEFATCKIGLVGVLLHVVIAVLVIFFDYVLFFLLFLLNKHGQVVFSVSGQSKIELRVEGTGLISNIFRAFIEGIDVSQVYNSTVDLQTCLPSPKEPDRTTAYFLIGLYSLVLALVFLKAYGLRLRHKIVAFYYPEQETARMNYLHRHIIVKRSSFWKEARELVLSNMRNKDNPETVGFLEMLKEKNSCCRRICCGGRENSNKCDNCEVIAVTTGKCSNAGCSTILCEDCAAEFGQSCPTCLLKDEKDRISP